MSAIYKFLVTSYLIRKILTPHGGKVGQHWVFVKRAGVRGPVQRGGSAAPTRLYKRRWVIVFLFSSYSLCNGYQWIQYSIISNIMMKFYGVESVAVDWLSLIYMITYVCLIFPVTWLLDKAGDYSWNTATCS
uniref:Uncharacterized protein n=1 Tax=Mola mola TaxID=94237 RepID=A0A3Q3VZQ9_MOLML